jgi:hypothetical protein
MGGLTPEGNLVAIAATDEGKLEVDVAVSGGGDASASNQSEQIAIDTAIRDRLPSALVNDRLKTDSSGVTQPVSVSSLPLPSGAATDTTLQQVRDAIKAQIDIASTIWTDNSGAFYVRRDLVNEATGTITVSFTDPSGTATTPGAGLRPLASTDKDTITDFYDVLTSGTGYSVGDLLARVAILDVNSGSPSASFIWLNLTVGTIFGSAPTSANIERANESIGARQVGSWSVALSTVDAANLLNLSNAIGTPVTGVAMPAGGSGWFGWLSGIFSFVSRLPFLGQNTAANSTPVTLSTDGIFATFAGLASDAASITGSIHAKLRAIATSLAQGQAVMASSISVAIASNQSAFPVTIPDGLTISGSISSLGNVFSQDTTGYQSVAVQVTNVGGGVTITYEQSNDNTTWYVCNGFDLSSIGSPLFTQTFTNTIGLKIFPIYARYFRARVSTYVSGTISTVAIFRTAPYQGLTQVQQATNTNLNVSAICVGNVTQGGSTGGAYAPVQIAAESRTSLRTTTVDGSISRPIVDKVGRTITKNGTIRELQYNNQVTLSSTTETTLIPTGGSSIFTDITDLIISNTSGTGTRIDIRDTAGGTIQFSVWLAPTNTQVFSFTGILRQNTSNTAWSAQLSTAVTDVRITAIAERTS